MKYFFHLVNFVPSFGEKQLPNYDKNNFNFNSEIDLNSRGSITYPNDLPC